MPIKRGEKNNPSRTFYTFECHACNRTLFAVVTNHIHSFASILVMVPSQRCQRFANIVLMVPSQANDAKDATDANDSLAFAKPMMPYKPPMPTTIVLR